MADEEGSSVSKVVGKAAMKTFMSPSIDIVKQIPQGIIEVSLRGAGAVLALIALIAAGTCQGYVRPFLGLGIQGIGVIVQTNAAAGWVIFLSFWVMLYQVLAIVQLFLHVKFMYFKIPVINWSVFFLVDIIAIGIAAGGYFCGAIPMAVYAGQWAANPAFPVTTGSDASRINSAAGATSAFCFFGLVLFIGMIVYFFLARYVLKWSTHGEPQGEAQARGDNYAPQQDDE